MWRTTRALMGAALVLLSAGTLTNAKTIDFKSDTSFTVGNSPYVHVENISGDITVEPCDGLVASVATTIRVRGADDEQEAREIADLITVEIDGDDEEINAVVDYPRDFSKMLRNDFGRGRSIEVNFHLRVPASSRLSASSVSGDITTHDISGDARLSTVSGDVDGDNLPSDIKASTVSGELRLTRVGEATVTNVSGDIVLIDVNGECEGGTTSGDFTIRGGEGYLDAKSVSGTVIVENRRGGFTVQSISGDVLIQSAGSNGEGMDVKTVSGDIELELDAGDGCEFTVQSFSGDLDIDKTFKSFRRRKSGRISGTFGNGKGELNASSTSGDILLSSR